MKLKKELIKDWLLMAQIDIKSAEAALKDEIYSTVCFHSQQAVEKSFKAFLLNFESEVIKTHDLLLLFQRSVKYESRLRKFKKNIGFLNKFYVPTRYPDAFPGSLPEGLPQKPEAERSLKEAKEILKFLSERLI